MWKVWKTMECNEIKCKEIMSVWGLCAMGYAIVFRNYL